MRYGAEHKQQTRKRVLKAAVKQIRERGPQGIALTGVMREAGLTHGGFYAHFKSKDELVSAAVDSMFDDSPGRLLREGLHQSPDEVLSRFIDLYLSPDHRDMLGAGCPLPSLSGDARRLNHVLQDQIANGISAMFKLVNDQLVALGCRRSEELASATVSQLIGAVIVARALPDRKQSDAMLDRTRSTVRRHLGLENKP